MITLNEMLEHLNDDLSNEYQHWHYYIHAAIMIQGLERESLQAYLLKEAQGEMTHIQEFGQLIMGLGGKPTTSVNGFRNALTDAKTILYTAMQMEDEVVANYVKRKKEAQTLGGVSGSVIETFMDNQILASRSDADHLRQMLAGL